MDLQRREAAKAIAGLFVAWAATPIAKSFAATAAGDAAALDAKRLTRFMERIAGLSLWDQTFAQWMIDSLDSLGRERLATLVASAEGWPDERFRQETQPGGVLGDVADAVLRLCFTGKAEVNGKPVYVDYLQALAWRAAGVKPGTQCDPAGFGGWAKPPEPF